MNAYRSIGPRRLGVGLALSVLLSLGPVAATGQGLASLHVSPADQIGGSLLKATVRLTTAAPAGGFAVALASSDAAAKPPASIVVSEGATEAVVAIPTYRVTTAKPVTITASGGGVQKSDAVELVTINWNDFSLFCGYNGELHRYDLLENRWTQLTTGWPTYNPQAGVSVSSFDGTVAVGYARFGNDGTQLCLVDGAGAFTRTRITYGGQSWNPAFSPDGKRLLYLHTNSTASWGNFGSSNVRVYDLMTGQHSGDLLPAGENPGNVRWLPDGNGFAYSVGNDLKRHDNNGLITVIASSPYGMGFGDLSPNQERIFRWGNSTGVWSIEEIYLADGSQHTCIAYSLMGALYCPDGTILFVGDNGKIDQYDPITGGGYTTIVGTAPGLSTELVPEFLVRKATLPVPTEDQYEAGGDQVLTVSAPGVKANDLSATGWDCEVVVPTQHGTIALEQDGSFVYQPDPGYTGTDTFSYRLARGFVTTKSVVVSIDVTPSWVQWAGNGHWYKAVLVPSGITWHEAEAAAEAEGGFLATLTSAEENAFVFGLVDQARYWYKRAGGQQGIGPWIGLFQAPGSLEPAGGWSWITGEPFAFSAWNENEPNDWDTGEEAGHFFCTTHPNLTPKWNDRPDGSPENPIGYVVERYGADPVPADDSYATSEDQALTVPAAGVKANDPDCFGWSAVAASQPSHGTLALAADGGFVYTPAADFHGSDSFKYRLEKGGSPSAEASVTIEVASVEDPIVVQAPGETTGSEHTEIAFTASASNVDHPGAVYAYSLSGAPAGATIGLFTGAFKWTPAEEYGPGEYTFDVVATGNWTPETTGRKTVRVVVEELNLPPTIDPVSNQTADEEAPFQLQLTATDPDSPSQALAFSLVSGPAGMAVSEGGLLTWTPTEADGPGSIQATVRVKDPGGLSSETSFTVAVKDVRKTFKGTVDLQEFVGDPRDEAVSFEFRLPGSPDSLWVRYGVGLSASGGFSFNGAVLSEIPAGTYDVLCKGSHWLRQRIASVTVTGAGVEGLSFSLVNGDVDGDNLVTVFDYNVLSEAFDSSPGDASWVSGADLDGDGAVTVFDYNIVSTNFDKVGD